MKLYLKKVAPITFTVASDVDMPAADTLPYGEELVCEIKRIRNPKLHRKYMSLLRFAFEYFEPMPVKNIVPMKDFDTFREWVICATGRHDVIGLPGGGVRLKAHSISFAKMDDSSFARLYSDTINVLLGMMSQYGFNEESLRNAVETILNYD